MPRHRHDSLSKDLLSLWLEPLGRIESPRRVHGEERQIDVVLLAAPDGPEARAYRRHLGLLGRIAQGISALEPFRNPCTRRELRTCIAKLIELEEEGFRRARRRKADPASVPLPQLWVVSPTLSDEFLARTGARRRRGFPAGFFDLAEILNTTLVVVSRLPATPETLWLRLLGRGAVQRRAIDELARLPHEHPLRRETQRRMLRWRAEAAERPNPSEADLELIMNGERLLSQREKRVRRESEAKGKAEGLRVAIGDLCELLGVAISASRRTSLEAMGVGELEALRLALKQTQRWPDRAAPKPRAKGAARRPVQTRLGRLPLETSGR